MVEDLSTQHGPVSELFGKPVTPEGWSRLRLTGDQVEFYRRHGYLAGIKLLNRKQLEELRA